MRTGKPFAGLVVLLGLTAALGCGRRGDSGGRTGLLEALAFSPDGKTLASAGDDPAIRLTDVKTGQEYARVEHHCGAVGDLAFSPDGRLLAASSVAEGVLRVWDTATWEERGATHAGSRSGVSFIAFSPDGTTLAGGGGYRVRRWSMPALEEQAALGEYSHGPFGMAFSPDGQTLATAGGFGGLGLWDTRTGWRWRHPPGPAFVVAYSPDGRLVATSDNAGSVRLVDATTGEEKRVLGPPARLGDSPAGVSSLVFSPDGKLLLVGLDAGPKKPGAVKVWDPEAGEGRATLDLPGGGVRRVVMSPDGKVFATANTDIKGGALTGVVKLWKVEEVLSEGP